MAHTRNIVMPRRPLPAPPEVDSRDFHHHITDDIPWCHADFVDSDEIYSNQQDFVQVQTGDVSKSVLDPPPALPPRQIFSHTKPRPQDTQITPSFSMDRPIQPNVQQSGTRPVPTPNSHFQPKVPPSINMSPDVGTFDEVYESIEDPSPAASNLNHGPPPEPEFKADSMPEDVYEQPNGAESPGGLNCAEDDCMYMAPDNPEFEVEQQPFVIGGNRRRIVPVPACDSIDDDVDYEVCEDISPQVPQGRQKQTPTNSINNCNTKTNTLWTKGGQSSPQISSKNVTNGIDSCLSNNVKVTSQQQKTSPSTIDQIKGKLGASNSFLTNSAMHPTHKISLNRKDPKSSSFPQIQKPVANISNVNGKSGFADISSYHKKKILPQPPNTDALLNTPSSNDNKSKNPKPSVNNIKMLFESNVFSTPVDNVKINSPEVHTPSPTTERNGVKAKPSVPTKKPEVNIDNTSKPADNKTENFVPDRRSPVVSVPDRRSPVVSVPDRRSPVVNTKIPQESINAAITDKLSTSHISRPVPLPNSSDQESIYNQSWYKSSIDRNEALTLLQSLREDGAFLVRKSRTGGEANPYTLMLLYNGNVSNLHIRKRSDQKYALGSEKPDEKVFTTVNEMINFHMTSYIEVLNKNNPSESERVKLSVFPQ